MKIVGDSVYTHVSAVGDLPKELRVKLEKARKFFEKHSAKTEPVLNSQDTWIAPGTFNVVKVNKKIDRVSFLCYPGFWQQDFPELLASWTVDCISGSFEIRHRKYNPENPPILHRRELFIRTTHPNRPEMEHITRTCEEAGCFEDTKRIGYKKHWLKILAQKGLQL